jgi:peptide/nickel transport system ATP-binding protein
MNNDLLEIKNIKKYFPIEKGFLRRPVGYLKAVDKVNLHIKEGKTLGLVGESGCGKTTLGRCILRGIEPTEGSIFFKLDGKIIDITKLNKKKLTTIRRYAQMIFQDPYSSLDPRMTVLDLIGEPLLINNICRKKEMEERVKELVKLVGLNVKHLRRYSHAFSGGQRQRIGIARALSLNPKFIVCDEAVSALDVSVQSSILNLLQDLQKEFKLTYLFISHDLSVIEHMSDNVAVMYTGKIVELAKTEELFLHPMCPYTEALLSSIPIPNPNIKMERIILSGEIANPANPPSGCYFHPRCKYAKEICKKEEPGWKEVKPDHFVACHFAKELNLRGVPV